MVEYLEGERPYGYLLSGEEEYDVLEPDAYYPPEGRESAEPLGGETVEGVRSYEAQTSPSSRRPTRREAEAARERARYEEELARKQAGAKMSQAELEILRMKKSEQELKRAKFERYKDIKGEVTKTAGQISKAFAPGYKGKVSELYLGKPKRDLYVPETPSADFLKTSPAGRMHKPQLGALKREVTPPVGPRISGIPSQAGRKPIDYSFLREAGRLRSEGPLGAMVTSQLQGTSRLEQMVFAEIVDNNDRDTMNHIKDEVSRLGYKREDVERAVRSLESQGFVEKQKLLPSGQAEYVVR